MEINHTINKLANSNIEEEIAHAVIIGTLYTMAILSAPSKQNRLLYVFVMINLTMSCYLLFVASHGVGETAEVLHQTHSGAF